MNTEKPIIGIVPTEKGINYCGDDWKDNLSIEEKNNHLKNGFFTNNKFIQ